MDTCEFWSTVSKNFQAVFNETKAAWSVFIGTSVTKLERREL